MQEGVFKSEWKDYPVRPYEGYITDRAAEGYPPGKVLPLKGMEVWGPTSVDPANEGFQLRAPSQENYYLKGLLPLGYNNEVSITHLDGGTYAIKDNKDTILYYASTPVHRDCCGCGGRYVTGSKFHVYTPDDQPLLWVEEFVQKFCCTTRSQTWEVMLKASVILGEVIPNTNYRTLLLKSKTGASLCSIEKLFGYFASYDRMYKILTSSSFDSGSISYNKISRQLRLSFPRGFDVPRRALLMASAIVLLYQIEEEDHELVVQRGRVIRRGVGVGGDGDGNGFGGAAGGVDWKAGVVVGGVEDEEEDREKEREEVMAVFTT
ncbi:uncharacterized protein LOC135218729 [Macrobrachium nipponense]|uniref:uncharacterized protein LOC135218729 n=1 Tax=Macrobrachium nipponense TaxID=159736 RepID=UPI0030C7A555